MASRRSVVAAATAQRALAAAARAPASTTARVATPTAAGAVAAAASAAASLSGSRAATRGVVAAAAATAEQQQQQRRRRAPRLAGMGSSIWAEFTPLAQASGAINLGQGFPDFQGAAEGLPPFVLDAAERALADPAAVQYSRSQGQLRLAPALARYYTPLVGLGRDLDAQREVLTTVGATEGLFLAAQALLGPGDEAVLIDPHYDAYPMDVQLATGAPGGAKFVPLRPKGEDGPLPQSSADYELDIDELEAAITPGKTKLLIVNNPQNVVGKVHTRQELEKIAQVAIKHDLTVVSDEVYEILTYDGVEHVRIASLPGMWERTLTLGSAGKTFSLTGFKIGWMVGPPSLVEAAFFVHQNVSFCVASPLQDAVAAGVERMLEDGGEYVKATQSEYQRKRDKLCDILRGAGLRPIVPQGSYFVLADTSGIDPNRYASGADPTRPDLSSSHVFCRWLTQEIGVAAIPPSAFYAPQHADLADNLARFAFCKRDATLDAAGERLAQLKRG